MPVSSYSSSGDRSVRPFISVVVLKIVSPGCLLVLSHAVHLCLSVVKVLIFQRNRRSSAAKKSVAPLRGLCSPVLLYPKFLFSCKDFHAAFASFHIQLWRPENLERLNSAGSNIYKLLLLPLRPLRPLR